MTNTNSFDQLVQDIQSCGILGSPQATGFYECYCPVCGEDKRKTAGFRFEADQIVFHCFKAKCDSSCVYTLNEPISRKFRHLMELINVEIPLDLRMRKSSFQIKMEEELDDDLYKKNFYHEMKVPDGWIPLEESSMAEPWIEYLEDRHCDPTDMFYISQGDAKGLVAQGCYFFDKLIGFQVLNPFGRVKYWTESDNQHLMFINGRKIPNTVILVEGLLDAKCFPNAVGVLRGSVSPEQAFHLRGKRVIMIPDRSGNSFLKQAKQYGWEICVPPWNEKDLNSAVCRYGTMNCARMILEGIQPSAHKAELTYNIWTGDYTDD